MFVATFFLRFVIIWMVVRYKNIGFSKVYTGNFMVLFCFLFFRSDHAIFSEA